ncbi:hypothetical protein R0J90_12460, partial [Micrococcus sp. SIMBA_144]
GDVSSYSSGHAYFLMSKRYARSSSKEVVIVGSNRNHNKESWIQFLQQNFLPELTVMSIEDPTELTEAAPFAANFQNTNETTIYICENFSCSLPETDVDKVMKELEK